MIKQSEAKEILNLLRSLPADKIAEVKDFALFLKARYGTEAEAVDESSEWSEEDIKDLSATTLDYSDQVL
jgi:hypothetical protein